MSKTYLLKLGSINGKNGLLNALLHNKRQLQRERNSNSHIDFVKSILNYSLVGDDTAVNIANYARLQMFKAGIEKPRKNGVMAVEIIFSLPPSWHNRDTKPFFLDCYQWVLRNFDGELLGFDVHADEAAPHAHAIILPIINGKMQGNKMKGNTSNLRRLNNLFHMEVAQQYGLSKSEFKRLTSLQKRSIEQCVLSHLKQDSVIESSIYSCVRDNIRNDPIPYAVALGIELKIPKPKVTKSFIQIMTSKGKGSNLESKH